MCLTKIGASSSRADAERQHLQYCLYRISYRQSQIDPLVRLSMACPALPMCGLAITEAERRMPSYMERIRAMMDK